MNKRQRKKAENKRSSNVIIGVDLAKGESRTVYMPIPSAILREIYKTISWEEVLDCQTKET